MSRQVIGATLPLALPLLFICALVAVMLWGGGELSSADRPMLSQEPGRITEAVTSYEATGRP